MTDTSSLDILQVLFTIIGENAVSTKTILSMTKARVTELILNIKEMVGAYKVVHQIVDLSVAGSRPVIPPTLPLGFQRFLNIFKNLYSLYMQHCN